jgi:hypothetical protein
MFNISKHWDKVLILVLFEYQIVCSEEKPNLGFNTEFLNKY